MDLSSMLLKKKFALNLIGYGPLPGRSFKTSDLTDLEDVISEVAQAFFIADEQVLEHQTLDLGGGLYGRPSFDLCGRLTVYLAFVSEEESC